MPTPDPSIAAHLEWLGFVRPTGLVVSAPALARHGATLNRHDAEGQQRLRSCVEERAINGDAAPARAAGLPRLRARRAGLALLPKPTPATLGLHHRPHGNLRHRSPHQRATRTPPARHRRTSLPAPQRHIAELDLRPWRNYDLREALATNSSNTPCGFNDFLPRILPAFKSANLTSGGAASQSVRSYGTLPPDLAIARIAKRLVACDCASRYTSMRASKKPSCPLSAKIVKIQTAW